MFIKVFKKNYKSLCPTGFEKLFAALFNCFSILIKIELLDQPITARQAQLITQKESHIKKFVALPLV